jgi:hypothetical protein
MNESIELFLMTTCLVTFFVSFWISNLIIANSLARVISLHASTKFKVDYKKLELLCLDKKNKYFINLGVALLIGVGYFTFIDYGVYYTSLIPIISLTSIFLSQQFIHADIFAKERLDELLSLLLEKESHYKKESNPQLLNVQLLCNYLIDEYKYESSSNKIKNSSSIKNNYSDFEKAKNNIFNSSNDLSIGIKILLLVVAISLLSIGLRQLVREDNKKQNINPTIILEDMQKLADENNKLK